MADNGLTFPIRFDLQAGVDEAAKDWDKYAKKLEAAIAKRAVKIRLRLDTNSLDNIDAVKQRLAQLKITPITDENKAAIRDLVKELKELAKAMEKVSNLRGIELPELQAAKAAKLRKEVEQADEKLRLSQERVRQAQERLTLSQERAAQQARKTSYAYGEQSSYLQNLIRKMVAVWSVERVRSFLVNLREVTAQFELQRVSLGAIIQSQTKANALFSEIKQFALKSPVSILDLTKYTKQVAAYGFETDKLFDTTKMLADISVGLGISLDRLSLFIGQVKARGALFSSEIRQATEAGIPLVELLAKKYSELNGQMVTTAQVQKMVEKGMVSFSMVEEIFKDMTSAGGMFYNMQEEQGNTLFGLWAKLGDAASVMYEEIGNTDSVNKGMKEAINMLTEFMRNWKAVGLTMATIGVPTALIIAAKKLGDTAITARVTTATKARVAAERELQLVLQGVSRANEQAARATLAKAQADEKAAVAARSAATSQQVLTAGFKSLGKTLLKGVGIGLVITALTTLVYKIAETITNLNKLKNSLGDIQAEMSVLQSQSVRNFEFLANAAVNAADGSKAQKDALGELQRTYKDIIPVEDLKIENLRKMQGHYESITQAIEEYIAVQQKEKAISTVNEYYGEKIRKYTQGVREVLVDNDLGKEEIGRFFGEFEKQAQIEGKYIANQFVDALTATGVDKKTAWKVWKDFEFSQRDIMNITDTNNDKIRGLSEAYRDQATELRGLMDVYADSM